MKFMQQLQQCMQAGTVAARMMRNRVLPFKGMLSNSLG
jgi:hypothetical protein